MSDHWPADPGDAPPVPGSLPPGWGAQPSGPPLTEPPSYGAGPPLPPMPTLPSMKGNRGLVAAVAVAAALLLVAIGTLVYVSRPAEPVAAGSGTTTTSTTKRSSSTTAPSSSGPAPTTPGSSITPPTSSPVPTTPPGPAPTTAELDATVADISAFVEEERGLRFNTPVKVELLDSDQFDARLLTLFDQGKDAREQLAKTLVALALVDPAVDVEATLRKLVTASVLGFYDSNSKALVVRGAAITPYTRQVIAHELTHALDDQHFNLERPQYESEKDEIGFGLSAVAEGDARRIENRYVEEMSAADRQARDKEEAAYARANPVAGMPLILLELLQAPYEFGPSFVGDIVDHGGDAELASAFTDPPRTSAQVLHVDRWFAHDERVDVPKPPADGKELFDGVFGELLTRYTLESGIDASVATRAADGWAGDWSVIYEDDSGATCIRIDYAMTTPDDLIQLNTAFTAWAQTHPGAEVRAMGDLLRVTSCSSSSGGGQSPL